MDQPIKLAALHKSMFAYLLIPDSVAYYQENDELRFNGQPRICMDGEDRWMDIL